MSEKTISVVTYPGGALEQMAIIRISNKMKFVYIPASLVRAFYTLPENLPVIMKGIKLIPLGLYIRGVVT